MTLRKTENQGVSAAASKAPDDPDPDRGGPSGGQGK